MVTPAQLRFIASAFRAADEVCALRAIMHHRSRLIEDAGRFIQHAKIHARDEHQT